MVSSALLVIGWIEFVVAGAVLLLITRLLVARLRQPIDRINLIVMSLLSVACIPLGLGLMHAPAWQLGLLESEESTLNQTCWIRLPRHRTHRTRPSQKRFHPIRLPRKKSMRRASPRDLAIQVGWSI